ncbi:MAG: leucine-rich repeat domain-containing protein [Saccharofermentans sp.]|nr:leucine-rich repeat domain-containing protein [Saccharofermentans sp.]
MEAKSLKILVSVLAAALAIFVFFSLPEATVTVNAASGIEINETNFPDENFRSYVSKECDKDGNGFLSDSEISKVKSIYVVFCSITDMKGIEYFTSLEYLYCFNNKITSLDLSKNTELKELRCHSNKLTSLDVRMNTALTELVCSYNLITSLDVSRNIYLKELDCADLKVSSLDLRRNTVLTHIDCHYNQLTSLDVSKNTGLTYLNCNDNKLQELDLSRNTALTFLSCEKNQLKSLDLSRNTVLRELLCYNNQLSGLDLRKNSALKQLRCFNNSLKYLFIGDNQYLLEAFTTGVYPRKLTGLPDSAIHYGQDFSSSSDNGFIIDRSVTLITAYGWNKISNNWIYLKDDATIATGWFKVGSNWYYSDANGFVQTGWIKEGGAWFYLRSTGEMATGWQQISGGWYYFDVNGKMRTGWQKIGGVDYYFKSNGAMASEEYVNGYYLDKSGAWTYKYRASWKSDTKGTYFQDANGWYPKNRWLKIDNKWYFFKPDGYMAAEEYRNGYWLNTNGTWTYTARASWKKNSKGWYYQDTAGWYAKNGTWKIDGKNYNFDAKGYCTNP